MLHQEICSCSKCFAEPNALKDAEKLAEETNDHHICCGFKMCLLGHGNYDARVAFIGEAPSLAPTGNRMVFGHKSFPVFFKLLEELDLKFEDVYLTNLVKCYLPHAQTGEIVNCDVYLEREIRVLSPPICILFGQKVVKHFFPEASIWGEKHTRSGVFGRIYLTLPHPMLCVYRPEMKETYFKTVRKVKRLMDQKSLEFWQK